MYAGAGDAEIAWEEATEGERVYAENRWGWRCRNIMGGGYGGGARECMLRIGRRLRRERGLSAR